MNKGRHALTESRSGCARFISAALRRHFAETREPLKRVSKIVKRGERTAENYYEGKVAPGVPEFLRLCKAVPELAAAVAKILEFGESDPAAIRLMDEIRRYTEARGGA